MDHRLASRWRWGWRLTLLGVCCLACSPAPEVHDRSADELAVRALLADQVEAWNAGDLEGFMAGYLRDDELRFASGGEVHSGWEATLERYRRRYGDRQAMGTLRFEDLDVRVLDRQWAVAFGGWRLLRESDEPRGLFTLLLERRTEGWRIVHDHTSSAEP